MTEPLSLETILSEFDENAEVWVLKDETLGKYVVIPDDRFPGRRPIRFFMKREDAETVLRELVDENADLREKDIYPVKIHLKPAIRGIASDRNPANANAFVLHSPNEVYEWIRDRVQSQVLGTLDLTAQAKGPGAHGQLTPSYYAQVNGIRITYDQAGNGYPVLLLHGFPRNRKAWSKLMPLLSQPFTLVAPDRRGYGDSDRPSDPSVYGNETMVLDSFELMRQLGYGEFLVAGHDRGAPVAQRLAADYPDIVRGVVILDNAPQGVPGPQRPDPSGRTWYLAFFRQRGVAERIMGQNPRLFFSLFLDRNPHLTPQEHEYYLEQFCKPGSVEAVLADYRAGLENDPLYWKKWLEEGRKITTPICALWGDSGPSAGLPMLDLWRQIASDVRGTVIQGAAHYVQEQQPETVARRLQEFADELGIP